MIVKGTQNCCIFQYFGHKSQILVTLYLSTYIIMPKPIISIIIFEKNHESYGGPPFLNYPRKYPILSIKVLFWSIQKQSHSPQVASGEWVVQRWYKS